MPRTKKATPLTATEIAERLRARYEPPEWVLLEEVQPGVGWLAKPRRTDMLGLSTWQSRGLRMVGFEFKSSRADVMKELKDPTKAEAMQRFCDRWYLVLGRSDLIGHDELPPKWGLIVPHGKGLKIAVNAPELEPEPWPKGLIYMLVRKAFGNSIEDVEVDKIRKEAYADARTSNQYHLDRLKELEDKVLAFENLTGISIRYGGAERIKDQAKLLKIVMRDGLEGYRLRTRRLAEQAERIGKELREALDENEDEAHGD